MGSAVLDVADFSCEIVMLDQGTDAWKQWRKGIPGTADAWAITATDAPVIMGDSKFATVDILWRRKLGMLPPQFVSAAMKRGHYLEPKARDAYEETYGEFFSPVCVQVKQAPWLKASLDGLSFEGQEILEIKCPNAQTHAEALAGNVPLMYWIQMQHQLMCSGAERCWYYSFDGECGAPRIEVLPDRDFQKQLLEKEIYFRGCLFNQTHPEGEAWVEAAKRFALLKADVEAAAAALETVESVLIEMLGDERSRQGGGVKVTRSLVEGKVDYQAYLCKQLGLDSISTEDLLRFYAEKNGVDLTQADSLSEFKKPNSIRNRVTIAKDIDLDAIKAEIDSVISPEQTNQLILATSAEDPSFGAWQI